MAAAIAADTANIVVQTYGITVASRSFDLCTLVKCPVTHEVQFAVSYVIPSAAPTQVDLTVVVTLSDERARAAAGVRAAADGPQPAEAVTL